MKSQRPSPADPIVPSNSVDPPIGRLLAMAVGARLFVDTGIQIFAPFFLIERFGWRAPFLVLGAGLLGGFFVFGRLVGIHRSNPGRAGYVRS